MPVKYCCETTGNKMLLVVPEDGTGRHQGGLELSVFPKVPAFLSGTHAVRRGIVISHKPCHYPFRFGHILRGIKPGTFFQRYKGVSRRGLVFRLHHHRWFRQSQLE